MLESALSDIKEAPAGGLASLTRQVLWLLRLLQDFLCSEGHGNQELWSEKVRGLRGGPVSSCTESAGVRWTCVQSWAGGEGMVVAVCSPGWVPTGV